MYNRAVFVERQLKELQDAHKKAEYQSIKKIGGSSDAKCTYHCLAMSD